MPSVCLPKQIIWHTPIHVQKMQRTKLSALLLGNHVPAGMRQMSMLMSPRYHRLWKDIHLIHTMKLMGVHTMKGNSSSPQNFS
uniref:Uncharacterized protein n=1 Tax=Zea mays TaxID=4577 RepID=C0PNQ6_MAIZE|nr:unknown [Zea mays]